MAFFDNYSIKKGGKKLSKSSKNQLDPDVLSIRMYNDKETPPSISLGIFSDQGNFVRKASDDFSKNLNQGNYDTAVSFIFHDLVEYKIKKGEGKNYIPGKHTIVKQKLLLSEGYDEICVNTKDKRYDYFKVVNVTNNAQNFSVQSQVSSIVGLNSNYQIITPKSIKFDVRVKHFPFNKTKSYLALGLILAISSSSESNVTTPITQTKPNVIKLLGDQEIYFVWSETARDDSESGSPLQVRTSGLLNATVEDLPGLSQGMFFEGGQKKNLLVKKIYFSFRRNHPSHIYWDPLIAVQEIPKDQGLISGKKVKFAMLIVVGIIVVITAILIVVYILSAVKERKAMKNEETDPLFAGTVNTEYNGSTKYPNVTFPHERNDLTENGDVESSIQ